MNSMVRHMGLATNCRGKVSPKKVCCRILRLFVIWVPILFYTGTHILKTTIEISDELAKKARAYAAKHQITLRALIEQGIQGVLRESQHRAVFDLRDASVGGRGLQRDYQGADWAKIREAAYEGRGS